MQTQDNSFYRARCKREDLFTSTLRKKMKNKLLLFRLNGSDGACAACADVGSLPAFPVIAGTAATLSGGLPGIAIMKAGEAFTDVTSLSEWNAKIAAGDLLVRLNGCRVFGEKGDDTVSTDILGSCGEEEETKRTQEWTLEDRGNNTDYEMYDLYEYIRANYKCLQFAFISCDYRLHGFITSGTIAGTFMPARAAVVNDNIPRTRDEKVFIKASITTSRPGLIKPKLLTFLPTLTGLIN